MERYRHRYTSLRINQKIINQIEQIKEVAGCSRNSLMCALLDKHTKVLLLNRDLENKKDREALLAEVQQVLQEATN